MLICIQQIRYLAVRIDEHWQPCTIDIIIVIQSIDLSILSHVFPKWWFCCFTRNGRCYVLHHCWPVPKVTFGHLHLSRSITISGAPFWYGLQGRFCLISDPPSTQKGCSDCCMHAGWFTSVTVRCQSCNNCCMHAGWFTCVTVRCRSTMLDGLFVGRHLKFVWTYGKVLGLNHLVSLSWQLWLNCPIVLLAVMFDGLHCL